jgi:hypothetical protein
MKRARGGGIAKVEWLAANDMAVAKDAGARVRQCWSGDGSA